MNCHEYQADLGDYVDRSIPAPRAGAFEVHLAGCAQCRALVSDFRTLQTVAGSLERRTPPEQVWTRIATAIKLMNVLVARGLDRADSTRRTGLYGQRCSQRHR